MSKSRTTTRTAIGIVRQSRTRDSGGLSPGEQRERIEALCEREGFTLLRTDEELDTSGGNTLDKRPALKSAVADIEDGRADVLLVAYFDRLARKTKVGDEVMERVERAGGDVYAVDLGKVTNGKATTKLTIKFMADVAEYYREACKERFEDVHASAIARGVCPFPNVPPPFYKGEDRRLLVNPVQAPIVAEAYRLRSEGISVQRVRDYLKSNGLPMSYGGVVKLLESPLMVGELRFGKLVNPEACEPVVDRGIWLKVQRMKTPTGRRGESNRLLSRMRLVACASCGGTCVVSWTNGKSGKVHAYRCQTNRDCPAHAYINAELVEQMVTEAARGALQDLHGRASNDAQVQAAKADLEAAESHLETFLDGSDGLDAPTIKRKLRELTEAQKAAQTAYDQISQNQAGMVEIDPDADWDTLTLDERRAIIRATVESVTVAPTASGLKGADRVTVHMYGWAADERGIRRLRRGLGESVENTQKALDKAARARISAC